VRFRKALPFPDDLPADLAAILNSVSYNSSGESFPFLGTDWRPEICQFVGGDPTRLEIVLQGVLGGQLRLTARAKDFGEGWRSEGPLVPPPLPGEPDYSPIAIHLSRLIQETAIPKRKDVSADIDLMSRRASRL